MFDSILARAASCERVYSLESNFNHPPYDQARIQIVFDTRSGTHAIRRKGGKVGHQLEPIGSGSERDVYQTGHFWPNIRRS
jgi:hypothetical protein